MEDLIKVIILGIVEGLTEFLPVSSTGHMILTGNLLGYEGGSADTFKIVVQLGAVLAVFVLYFRRYLDIAKDMVRFKFDVPNKLNVIHMILAMLPALIVYLLLKDFIKGELFRPEPVLIALVAGGVLMIIAEMARRKVTSENTDDITYKQALAIGLFQCLALWTGFSRSGSTISGGLLFGVSRKAAADFTFIISVPVMLGATVLDMWDSRHLLTSDDLVLFLVGGISSFIVAMLAVVTFLNLIKSLKLFWFALYRFVLAAAFYWLVIL